MKAGNFESGCPALEESYRLDPLPGVLFTSAECHAQWGSTPPRSPATKTTCAPSKDAAAQQERQHGRDEISKQKISEFRPLVPQLTLVLPASAPDGTSSSAAHSSSVSRRSACRSPSIPASI